jgi:hypothetical protein
MRELDIKDGINVETEFIHIEAPSNYNWNYYTYKDKLLFGLSDDDCNTNWYIIKGNSTPIYLGYSDVRDDPEVLHRQESESH